ncbi:MAG: cation-translocating P-type ATPase, partial [Clostridiales bacterium]|nr:cation-translocating P-type ATPase [Clostridiales bacterium]
MSHPQGRKKGTRRKQETDHVWRPVEPVLADYRRGLTREEVAERLARGWDNHAVDSSLKSTGDIIRENIFTYFNLIFLILAILLCIVRSFRDLTFLPIIIVNTLIGIIQEVYAKNELEKMNVLTAPKATVVRDGKSGSVPTEKLVRDDIVLFRAGNQ